MAVFGIPVVHEDDALRALRAALEIRDAVTAIGEVQARIGVNTGDVLAAEAQLGESLVVGDAVNIAARLEQAAPAGAVLVGEATWALASHAAAGEPVAPVVAKGKSEPLAAWRLESVDPPAAGHRRRLDLPMVGPRDRARPGAAGRAPGPDARAAAHGDAHRASPASASRGSSPSWPGSTAAFTVLTGNCRATAAPSLMQPLLEVTQALSVAELMPDDPQAGAVASLPGAGRRRRGSGRRLGGFTADRRGLRSAAGGGGARGRALGRRLLLDVVEQLTDRVSAARSLWCAPPGPSSVSAGRGGAAAQTRSRSRSSGWTTEQTQELL